MRKGIAAAGSKYTYPPGGVTNLALHSNALQTNAPWVPDSFNSSISVLGNAVAAPNSLTEGAQITLGAVSASQVAQLYQAVTCAAAQHTFSLYLRAASSLTVYMWIYDGTTNSAPTACAVTTSWQRFTVTHAGPAGTWRCHVGNNRFGLAGTSDTPALVFFGWGAQVQLGGTATPLVPTTTSTVTTANAQVADSWAAIEASGSPCIKVYCGVDYLTDFPLESWSSTPTTAKAVAQTSEMATLLGRSWHTVVLTVFTFANGSTNWWRVNPTAAKLLAEYTEIRDLAEHLLTTFNGTGRRFVIQNWEGDWAFMDTFTPETYVARQIADRYVAFLGARRRAIEDARKAIASDCQVLFSFEANRVIEARTKPHLRRVLRDIAPRIQPDVVSYSAYDSTIDTSIGFGSSYSEWAAFTLPLFARALRQLQLAFPGVPIQVGEFGFPEVQAVGIGRDIVPMINALHSIASAAGVTDFIYWQAFDNEELLPGVPRGFYTVKPDGSTSMAGAAMAALP